MVIEITRDSVCMADDCVSDPTHSARFEVSLDGIDRADVTEKIIEVLRPALPKISGGEAVWVLMHDKPLAVVAQHVDEACIMYEGRRCDFVNHSVVQLHWNYQVQEDYKAICRIMSRLRFPQH